MCDAKFTKGNWNLFKGNSGYLELSTDFGDEIISWQGFDGVPFCDKEKEANANLIAAAPEMYDMLHSIENDANQIPPFLWDKIQSVLAKARGEHV